MKEARHKPLHMELVTPLIRSSHKRQNYTDRKRTPAAWGETRRLGPRAQERGNPLGGQRVLTWIWVDCGTAVRIYPNSLNHAVRMGAFYDMQSISG